MHGPGRRWCGLILNADGLDFQAPRMRTVHKHRNFPGHAPDAPHDEVSAGCRDVIHARTAKEVRAGPGAFPRK